MKLAFIGAGNMGSPIARNLLRAGHQVTVYNRTRARAEPLIQDGATLADSPADAARDAEAVITMLADDHAVRPAAESALQKIIKLIREAQQRKAPAQQFADKFSTYYTYGVLALSLAMFFVWWRGLHLAAFASTVESHSAFYRTMTLLVVSSPCALVLSIPSAVLAAIAHGARHRRIRSLPRLNARGRVQIKRGFQTLLVNLL